MLKRLLLIWLLIMWPLFQWMPVPRLHAQGIIKGPGIIKGSGIMTFGAGGGGTTVTYASIYCDADINSTSAPTTCHPGNPSAGEAVIGVVWIPNGDTISGVADGGSTYNSTTAYANGAHFQSQIWYTCNYAGNAAPTVTPGASQQVYATFVVLTGNTTSGTGCNDGAGPKNAQIASGTTSTGGAITTTNAHDVVLLLLSNNCGETYTAGTDGQGNAMTLVSTTGGAAGVAPAEYVNETATNTYTPTATLTSCSSGANAQTFAVK